MSLNNTTYVDDMAILYDARKNNNINNITEDLNKSMSHNITNVLLKKTTHLNE